MHSKLELFNLYSENLNLVSKRLFNDDSRKGQYLCPICFREFRIEDLNSDREFYLTDEHVPPKSVKWETKVLTCNSCNTKQGGILDSQLPIVVNAKAFFNREPGASLDTKFIINDKIKSAGTTTITDKQELHFFFDPRRTSPANNDQIKDLLQEGKKTPDINAEFQVGKFKNATISIIRAAYLWAFSVLGYGFVFNKNLNDYRRLMLDSDSSDDHLKKVIKGQFPDGARGINIIVEPENYGCYLVLIEPNLSNFSEKLGVLMPGNNSKGLELMSNINTEVSTKRLSYECNDLNGIHILMDSELCIFPYMYWLDKYGL